MSWVRIRPSRIKALNDLPWLVKLYSDDAIDYFDFEEHTRVETFEQAIEVADYFLGRGKQHEEIPTGS